MFGVTGISAALVAGAICLLWWSMKTSSEKKSLAAEEVAIAWIIKSGLVSEHQTETLQRAVREAEADLREQQLNSQALPVLVGAHAAARLRLGSGYLKAQPAIEQALSDGRIDIDFRAQYLCSWLISAANSE